MKTSFYYCDRCGGVKKKTDKIGIHVARKNISDIRWLQIRSGTGYKRDLDLCQNCLDEFKRWIENEDQS